MRKLPLKIRIIRAIGRDKCAKGYHQLGELEFGWLPCGGALRGLSYFWKRCVRPECSHWEPQESDEINDRCLTPLQTSLDEVKECLWQEERYDGRWKRTLSEYPQRVRQNRKYWDEFKRTGQ